MRALITIFLVFISILTFGQTKLDTLVFNKVNEYRVSMNIEPLKWDTTCFKASEIHTKYLVKTGKVGHTEDSLKDPKDRMRVFDKKGKWSIINEVAISTKPRNIKGTENEILEKLATDVVEGWKSSKDHNAALLDSLFIYFSGVSCVVVSKPSGFKDMKNYRVVATMLIVGGTYRKL
jgi:uncharacterized protein YkwD